MTVSQPPQLCEQELSRIVGAVDVTEVLGEQGGPLRRFGSSLGDAAGGYVRVFVGSGTVRKVVFQSIDLPSLGITSQMLFAFTAEDHLVPHWSFDVVAFEDGCAYHVDLLPRVDLAAHRPYLDAVYGPLTPTYLAGLRHPCRMDPELGPLQQAATSPWMIAFRCGDEHADEVRAVVHGYLEVWLALVDGRSPIPPLAAGVGTELARRDRAHRALLFSRDAGAVWDLLTPVIGADESERLRLDLVSNDASPRPERQ